MHIMKKILKNVVGSEPYAVFIALEHAKKSSRPRIKVHEQLEQILRTGKLIETVVTELDFCLISRNIIWQVYNKLFERLSRIENNLVDVYSVQIADQLVCEAQRRVEMPVSRHTPYIDDTALRLIWRENCRVRF